MRNIRLWTLAAIAASGCTTAAPLFAQSAQTPATGTIVGQVLQSGSDSAVYDVLIQIDSTRFATRTKADGKYRIGNVPAGRVRLVARRIGFGAKTYSGVVVKAGGTVEQDIRLTPLSAIVPDRTMAVEGDSTTSRARSVPGETITAIASDRP